MAYGYREDMRPGAASELVDSRNVIMDNRNAPACGRCAVPMWLVRQTVTMTDGGSQTRCDYECVRCGAFAAVEDR